MPRLPLSFTNLPPGIFHTFWFMENRDDLEDLSMPEDWVNMLPKPKENHRRKEGLAARHCLSLLMQEKGLILPKWHQIAQEKPHFINSDWHFSLSHSMGKWAGAALAQQALGLDLEPLNRSVEKVSARFLNVEEKKLFLKSKKNLVLAWSAKEAVYKLLGLKGLSFLSIEILDLNAEDMQVKVKLEKEEIYLRVWHASNQEVLACLALIQ